MLKYNILNEKGFFIGNICEECSKNITLKAGYKLQEISWIITCNKCKKRIL